MAQIKCTSQKHAILFIFLLKKKDKRRNASQPFLFLPKQKTSQVKKGLTHQNEQIFWLMTKKIIETWNKDR